MSGPVVARCRHDLVVDQCADCRPHRTVEVDPFDEPSGRGPWFIAHYAGTCSECGGRFEDYEPICWDGDQGYIGQCCGEPG